MFQNLKTNFKKTRAGFSLIELLVGISLVVILSTAFFVLVDPISWLAKARNAQRWQGITALMSALHRYRADNSGSLPNNLDNVWRMIGTDTSGCTQSCNTGSNQFVDNSKSKFDAGNYGGVTEWSNNHLQLTSGQSSGSYLSSIKDAGSATSWSPITWSESASAAGTVTADYNLDSNFTINNKNIARINEASGYFELRNNSPLDNSWGSLWSDNLLALWPMENGWNDISGRNEHSVEGYVNASNLISTNPSFETTSFTGWTRTTAGSSTITSNSVNYFHGIYSAGFYVDNSSSNAVLSRSAITTTAGLTYTFSFYAKGAIGGERLYYLIADSGNYVYDATTSAWVNCGANIPVCTPGQNNVSLTNQWSHIVKTVTTRAGTSSLRLYIGRRDPDTNYTFYVDAVRLEQAATVAGPTFFTPAKLGGYSGNFNGVDNSIITPLNPNTDIGNGQPFTFSSWVYVKSYPASTYVSLAAASLVSPGQFYFYIKNTNNPYIGLGDWAAETTGVGITTNSWQHYVVSYDGSRVRVYTNGRKPWISAAIGAKNFTSSVTRLGQTFGASPFVTPTSQLNGYMDDVAFWKRALTDDEIKDLYLSQVGGNYSIKKPYVKLLNSSTIPALSYLSGITPTVVGGDNTTAEYSVQVGSQDWWWGANGIGWVANNSGEIRTGTPWWSNNLMSLWHLNETAMNQAPGGLDAQDVSGNNNHGTAEASMTNANWIAGKLNNGLNFTTSTNYVSAPGNAVTGALSIGLWLKTNVGDTTQRDIITKSESVSNQRGYVLQLNNTSACSAVTGNLAFSLSANGSTSTTRCSAVAVNDGAWHHVVALFNPSLALGSRMKIYLDGQSSTGVLSGTEPATIFNSNKTLRLGGSYDTSAFSGTLDEIAIWNRTLSASEITRLYADQINNKHSNTKDEINTNLPNLAVTPTSTVNILAYLISNGAQVQLDNLDLGYYATSSGDAGNNITLQARSCTAPCSAESWSATFTTPDGSDFPGVAANRYFQYKVNFSNPTLNPWLINATTGFNSSATIDSCFNLSGALGNYLTAIPFDPTNGSANKTYYAIRVEPSDLIHIKACQAELGENIEKID